MPRLVRLDAARTGGSIREALAAAFGPKTKAILLNNPMNPAAKVFTARRARPDRRPRHRATTPIAICDEVYEHILFDGRRHVPLMTLAGHARADDPHRLGRQDLLADRLEGRLRHRGAARCSTRSPRRTSSRPSRRRPICRRRSPTASARTTPTTARSPATSRRSATGSPPASRELGFGVAPCAGTYFITADVGAARPRRQTTSSSAAHDDGGRRHRGARSRRSTPTPPRPSFVRFCFSKRDAVLTGALDRLGRWVERRKPAA